MEAVADFVRSATLVAVTVTFWAALIEAGAVYRPLVMLPTEGDSDQVTELLARPVTVAVNCAVWDADRVVVVGLTEMDPESEITLVVLASVTTPSGPMAITFWEESK